MIPRSPWVRLSLPLTLDVTKRSQLFQIIVERTISIVLGTDCLQSKVWLRPSCATQVGLGETSVRSASYAASSAARQPLRRYAAIGVHSGLACGAATGMHSAFEAMRQGWSSGAWEPRRHDDSRPVVPTIVFHGDRDMIVNPVNGDQVIAQSKAAADLRTKVSYGEAPGGISYTRTVQADESGRAILEQWVLHGAGHAWSGGSTAGSYTEPRGPEASREMVRFFLQSSPIDQSEQSHS
jgi:hypothetical protein